MDAVFEFLMQISGGNSTLVVSAFVFLSAAALAFGLMAVANVRFAVKRRASEISSGTAKSADDPNSLRYASKVAAHSSTSAGATRNASCTDITPTGGTGSLNKPPGSAMATRLEPTRNSTHFGPSLL